MKTKEIIQLAVAGVIFLVAGILVFNILAPRKAGTKSQLTYEKVTMIDPVFDQQLLDKLRDPTKAKNFYVPPDLNSGLGNTQPFSPIK